MFSGDVPFFSETLPSPPQFPLKHCSLFKLFSCQAYAFETERESQASACCLPFCPKSPEADGIIRGRK